GESRANLDPKPALLCLRVSQGLPGAGGGDRRPEPAALSVGEGNPGPTQAWRNHADPVVVYLPAKPQRQAAGTEGRQARPRLASPGLAREESLRHGRASASRPQGGALPGREGVPDRNFYYLIGLLVVEGSGSTFHCFWADDRSQEKTAEDECLRVIKSFPDYT